MINGIRRLVAAARAIAAEPKPAAPETAQWGESRTELAERRASGYFNVIAAIESQREVWRLKYYKAVHGHANAQAILESEIARQRIVLGNMLRVHNALLVDKGLQPVTVAGFLEPSAPPVGLATEYFKAMRAMLDTLPSLFPMPKEMHEHIPVKMAVADGVYVATLVLSAEESLTSQGSSEWEALRNLARMVVAARNADAWPIGTVVHAATVDTVQALLVVDPEKK